MRKIRKGDQVIVTTGRDKGRTGTVLKILNEGFKVLVEGANLIKRHTRGNPQKQIPGGIVEKEAPVHISNVAIFNAATGKPDRVGFKILKDGKKQRVYKSTGEVIVNEKVG
jgi:large subunit ribosomal protein L24